MEKRRCPNCNARISADARHCPECGTALRQRPQPRGRRREAARPGLPVVLLLVAAIFLFVFNRVGPSTALPVADSPEIPYPDVPRIPVGQAKAQFDAGEALFVDTRQAASYEQAHIPGAVLLPSSASREEYAALPGDVPIITYCT